MSLRKLFAPSVFSLLILASACTKDPVSTPEPGPDTTKDPPKDTTRFSPPGIGSWYLFESKSLQVASRLGDSNSLTITVLKDTAMAGLTGVTVLSLKYSQLSQPLFAYWHYQASGDLDVWDDDNNRWLFIPAATGSPSQHRIDTMKNGGRYQSERFQHLADFDTLTLGAERITCNVLYSETLTQVLDSNRKVLSKESSHDTLYYSPALRIVVEERTMLSINDKPATFSTLRLRSYSLK